MKKSWWGKGDQRGQSSPFLITTIIFVVLAIGFGVGFGWSYMQMVDYRDNVADKVGVAVEAAKKEQKAADQTQFNEDYKKPNYQFQGPSDYGGVTFDYPKTWSMYVAKDAKDGGDYQAYFFPRTVPPVNNQTAFSLRVLISNKSYDDILKTYESKIKKGDLTATTLTIGKTDKFSGYQGMRINGQFDKTINGSVVIFKIRDKTLQVFVDNQEYIKDFNETVIPSLKYEV